MGDNLLVPTIHVKTIIVQAAVGGAGCCGPRGASKVGRSVCVQSRPRQSGPPRAAAKWLAPIVMGTNRGQKQMRFFDRINRNDRISIEIALPTSAARTHETASAMPDHLAFLQPY